MDIGKTQKQLFQLPWYRKVKFKALLAVTTLFLALMLATTELTRLSGALFFEDRARTHLYAASQQVQTEIAQRTDKAEILVKLIADLSVAMSSEPTQLQRLIPELIDRHDADHLIAGGGVWPEPYQFDTNKERNSYFWGRDTEGRLEPYDDYNDPQGAGYHNEEWYVPARHLKAGRVYWSKSYTDPYSQQAMVTVTAPMYRDDVFIGVTTIDLKLEGLQETLHRATEDFDGYAFAIDKHGRFLSFPDKSMIRTELGTKTNGSLIPFTAFYRLPDTYPQFAQVVRELRNIHANNVNINLNAEIIELALKLEKQSYQIETREAITIAKELLHESAEAILHHYFDVDEDYFFNEPAINLALGLPEKGWHIVTAMPESYAQAFIDRQISYLNAMIGLFMFITLVLTTLLVDKQITNPLNALLRQLKGSAENPNNLDTLITIQDKSEFGQLAERFNQRTRELLASREKVQHLAQFDPLTNLPNRLLLTEYLNAQISDSNNNHSVAVMFIDIDNFKTLNDSLGHAVGDQLLIQLAERLTNVCRNTDFIARLGGDEFVAVTAGDYPNESPELQSTQMAKRVVQAVNKPFLLDGNEYHISVSMGIALHSGGSIDELLKHADSAMYHVKESGRNGWCFFEESMQIRADERLQIESDLRDAIQNGGLHLAYQPQIDQNNDCIGLEALLRWEHPQLGNIPPLKFISIAEESMLIQTLGNWVFKKACQQVVEWLNMGIAFDHVSINISPRQIQDSQFVDNIKAVLAETGVPTGKLMLEMTESVTINNPESVIGKMQELKAMGIRWSIDDFGTGYSSLTYLKRLPLDELKIDKSFIDDIHHSASDAAIVETIISIAQKFGFKTIAEGVETEQQRQALLEKGCYQFQGYLFSKPLVGDALASFLEPKQPRDQTSRLNLA